MFPEEKKRLHLLNEYCFVSIAGIYFMLQLYQSLLYYSGRRQYDTHLAVFEKRSVAEGLLQYCFPFLNPWLYLLCVDIK